MATQENDRIPLLQGTLDLLILRDTAFWRPAWTGIARVIQQSQDVLLVDHGTLYPALQRLEDKGWIAAVWGTSSNTARRGFTRSPNRGGNT